MRKLHLDPETLDVQSFETVPDAARHIGTVRARGETDEFTCPETCNYGKCTANYYTCDAHCGKVQTADVEKTCNLLCGIGGTGGNSMQTACLDCYSNAPGCTQFDGCHTVIETCYPCG